MSLGFREQPIPWSLGLCPRCRNRPYDTVFLGSKQEGHICGECWKDDRHADDASQINAPEGEMQDLIERLEKATGPDRNVDLAIDLLMRPQEYSKTVHDRAALGHPIDWLNDEDLPPFTYSINVALTLIPEGGRLLELGQWQDNGKPDGWFAQVTKWVHEDGCWIDRGFAYGVAEYGATKKPPLAPNGAVAICIAALKARAALIADDRGT